MLLACFCISPRTYFYSLLLILSSSLSPVLFKLKVMRFANNDLALLSVCLSVNPSCLSLSLSLSVSLSVSLCLPPSPPLYLFPPPPKKKKKRKKNFKKTKDKKEQKSKKVASFRLKQRILTSKNNCRFVLIASFLLLFPWLPFLNNRLFSPHLMKN